MFKKLPNGYELDICISDDFGDAKHHEKAYENYLADKVIQLFHDFGSLIRIGEIIDTSEMEYVTKRDIDSLTLKTIYFDCEMKRVRMWFDSDMFADNIEQAARKILGK